MMVEEWNGEEKRRIFDKLDILNGKTMQMLTISENLGQQVGEIKKRLDKQEDALDKFQEIRKNSCPFDSKILNSCNDMNKLDTKLNKFKEEDYSKFKLDTTNDITSIKTKVNVAYAIATPTAIAAIIMALEMIFGRR